MNSITLLGSVFFLTDYFVALIRRNLNALKERVTVQVPVYSVQCVFKFNVFFAFALFSHLLLGYTSFPLKYILKANGRVLVNRSQHYV